MFWVLMAGSTRWAAAPQSGPRQSTRAFLPPSDFFPRGPLADVIYSHTAFCRAVAGFDTSHPGYFTLNFRLFGDFQSIIDFNTQVSNGAFKLAVPEQQLDGPQILGPTIDQGCLGPAHRVCAIG